MTATTKTAAPKSTFKVGTCHHRGATGAPDCGKKIVGASANLCPAHQTAWAAASKARAAAAKAAATNAPILAVTRKSLSGLGDRLTVVPKSAGTSPATVGKKRAQRAPEVVPVAAFVAVE